MSEKALRGRILQGVVTSAKMDKTVVVSIVRRVTHPLYNKIVSRTTKVHVHDAEKRCKEGDKVEIQETRPISKTKSWVLLNILEQAS
ncbi:MAG TPA: 30S ribosomal protein S17 [Gammaproteobacteria bacterium]|nr:30S ribosomal protein S17 [Gammaproteobacteria bacterium]